jgi:hypothetical protein
LPSQSVGSQDGRVVDVDAVGMEVVDLAKVLVVVMDVVVVGRLRVLKAASASGQRRQPEPRAPDVPGLPADHVP